MTEPGTFDAWALEFETKAPRASGQLELYYGADSLDEAPRSLDEAIDGVRGRAQVLRLELEGER